MRVILIRSAIGVFCLLLLWLYASRPVSMWMDNWTTARVSSLSSPPIQYDGGEFRIGELTLTFAGLDNQRTDVKLQSDGSNRLILSTGGKSFPLGPRLSPPDPRGRPEIQFAPDAGDIVTLTLDRSRLSWPVFFDVKIMTRTAWFRRHAYYRLVWRKKSGAKLDVLWRYEQQYYPPNRVDAQSGWTAPFMMYNWATGLMRVAIDGKTAEEAAAEYIARVKGWAYSQYRIESRGKTPDGAADLIGAIYLADEHAEHPGGGKSIVLTVDRKTLRVVKETGWQ